MTVRIRNPDKNEVPAVSRILFSSARAATICLCDQYPGFKRREQRLIPYLVLLREGFAKTERITPVPGGLLPRLFTLTGLASGGLFSAALSFPGLMVPGIPLFKGLPALRSPDFPPRLREATAAASLNIEIYTTSATCPIRRSNISSFLRRFMQFLRHFSEKHHSASLKPRKK